MGERVGQLRLDVGSDAGAGYRGPAVCEIVGITYRQLDYWTRQGLVSPSVRSASGSGSQRLYAFADIVHLRVIKSLLDAGASLQRVRAAIDELRRLGRSPSEVTLVADASSIYALDDDAQVIDLLKSGQGVLAIALGPVVERLEGEVAAFPSERATPASSEASGGSEQTATAVDAT